MKKDLSNRILKYPKIQFKIVLPVFEKNLNLTENEQTVYKFLSKTMLKPISENCPLCPFGRSKTTQLLKGMEQKGIVVVEGKGRGQSIY